MLKLVHYVNVVMLPEIILTHYTNLIMIYYGTLHFAVCPHTGFFMYVCW